jgi:hypothetical protein
MQLNQATNKLDLSQLYGTTDDDAKKLRHFNQGLLLTSTDDSSLLPMAADETLCTDFLCFRSGDSRVNSNPFVTSIYTLFLRSHNQIATKFRQMIPRWNDDHMFKITKRINIAIFQKIIYNDWANIVLGEQIANEIRTKTIERDAQRHNTKKVSNEFGTAAIKFYNSMLPGSVKHYEEMKNNSTDENELEVSQETNLFELESTFYKPKKYVSSANKYDRLMKSILTQNSMLMDSSYVDDLAINYYQTKMHDNKVFGTDALSIDIQKGRDHGLATYTDYINKCLNVKINSWDDLNGIIVEDDLHKLRNIYASVHDIDLIVGGLSEKVPENSTVGPTFSCIISDQLVSSKLADTNFYDREEKISKTIKKYSAARLICDTSNLREVQENIFLVPSEK